MSNTFSKRHGLRQIHGAPITVRANASAELRDVMIQVAYECGFGPKTLRPVVCRTLPKRSDSNNSTEYPNLDDEIHSRSTSASGIECTISSRRYWGDAGIAVFIRRRPVRIGVERLLHRERYWLEARFISSPGTTAIA